VRPRRGARCAHGCGARTLARSGLTCSLAHTTFPLARPLARSLTCSRSRRSPFWFGCFAGAVPWAIVFSYLAGNGGVAQIPGFVWALLVVYAAFFNTFPLNMYLQYAQWHWWGDNFHGWPGSGYLFGERMYQVQSLVSKSFLLWLVVGGSNQPSSFTGSRI